MVPRAPGSTFETSQPSIARSCGSVQSTQGNCFFSQDSFVLASAVVPLIRSFFLLFHGMRLALPKTPCIMVGPQHYPEPRYIATLPPCPQQQHAEGNIYTYRHASNPIPSHHRFRINPPRLRSYLSRLSLLDGRTLMRLVARVSTLGFVS